MDNQLIERYLIEERKSMRDFYVNSFIVTHYIHVNWSRIGSLHTYSTYIEIDLYNKWLRNNKLEDILNESHD